jgi:hypothetical protein
VNAQISPQLRQTLKSPGDGRSSSPFHMPAASSVC